MIQQNDILFDFDDFSRSCKDKVKYETEWQAKFAADEQYDIRHTVLDWYKCKYCNSWHLTSSR